MATGFYVTAIKDGVQRKTAWLAGPFSTHEVALKAKATVSSAIREAYAAEGADWWLYGTAKLEANGDFATLPKGRANAMFPGLFEAQAKAA